MRELKDVLGVHADGGRLEGDHERVYLLVSVVAPTRRLVSLEMNSAYVVFA